MTINVTVPGYVPVTLHILPDQEIDQRTDGVVALLRHAGPCPEDTGLVVTLTQTDPVTIRQGMAELTRRLPV